MLINSPHPDGRPRPVRAIMWIMMFVADPERIGETTLPDGRLLGWAEWGPEDGTPVLLCPGAATSRWLGFGAGAVRPLGVRLVSVDRPGLGASSPSPGRTFADFTTDMSAFFALRGLERPAVVGNSQGAPFALACAVAGLASAVAVVSGADEVAAPEFATALPDELRGLVDRVAADPRGAEEFFRGFRADAMWTMVIGTDPPREAPRRRRDRRRRSLDARRPRPSHVDRSPPLEREEPACSDWTSARRDRFGLSGWDA